MRTAHTATARHLREAAAMSRLCYETIGFNPALAGTLMDREEAHMRLAKKKGDISLNQDALKALENKRKGPGS